MTFCQNCGESINSASAVIRVTPIGNTIKGVGNLIFGLMITIGSITVIAGIILSVSMESAWSLFVGLVSGAIIMIIGYIARVFTHGYGIIVSYCERRDDK
jgi:hypothetical protein